MFLLSFVKTHKENKNLRYSFKAEREVKFS